MKHTNMLSGSLNSKNGHVFHVTKTNAVINLENVKITNAEGESVSSESVEVSVTLDSSSAWTLTADSYVTEFNGDASNVISNGYTLYVGGAALTGTK